MLANVSYSFFVYLVSLCGGFAFVAFGFCFLGFGCIVLFLGLVAWLDFVLFGMFGWLVLFELLFMDMRIGICFVDLDYVD